MEERKEDGKVGRVRAMDCRCKSPGGGQSGEMQGGADAQLSRRSMQLHAKPHQRSTLAFVSLLYLVCVTSLSLFFSLHFPLSSVAAVLFSRPYQPSIASLFLPLSRSLAPSASPLVLLPLQFSLHPRSMTSARGNAPQRRFSFSLSRCFSLRLSFVLPPSIPLARSGILHPRRFLRRRCSLFTSVRDF